MRCQYEMGLKNWPDPDYVIVCWVTVFEVIIGLFKNRVLNAAAD